MKRTCTPEELLEHFTLLSGELAAVGNKSGPTRLGFAVLTSVLAIRRLFSPFEARGGTRSRTLSRRPDGD
jgi:hypothetical protein